MIELFCDYFEGTFNNKMQAMSYPTKFAMIELVHEKIDTNKFKCIQRYFVDKRAYRNAVIEVFEQGDKLLVKNYKEDGLTYMDGCDIIFEKIGNEFRGKNLCKNCFVTWSDKQTYLQTSSVLGSGYYNVVDRGFCVDSHKHIWGSFNGPFNFKKI